MEVLSRIEVWKGSFGALAVAVVLWAAPVGASEPCRVVEAGSPRVVIQGPCVKDLAVRMPVWISEVEPNGRPGLLLAEGIVASLHADRATLDVAERDVPQLRPGALVEPRFVAEARQYRTPLPRDAVRPEAGPAKAEPAVRARHKAPARLDWGKALWLEAVLDGPADKLSAFWRLGTSGPYTETALEPKGDGLFGAWVSPGESEPVHRVLAYYLIASGAGGRWGVAFHPADPREVPIESVPDERDENKVLHAAADRASHREPLEIVAQVNKRYVNPTVFYRARGSGRYHALPMQPLGAEQFRAEIPAKDVVVPGLAYHIAVTDEKGIVRNGFHSASNPYEVAVVMPQILHDASNRNRLHLQWAYADFGRAVDRYHEVEVGLERMFFGFLVARLNGCVAIGEAAPVEPTAAKAEPDLVPPAAIDTSLRLYRGRAGLDFHFGDYVSMYGDLSMGIYRGGGALGFRGGGRVGDDEVAAIDLDWERLWDARTGERVVDVLVGSLRIPVGDAWRVFGRATHESVLQGGDKALRFGGGAEFDLGRHVQVEASGGFAGRASHGGPTAGAALRLHF